MRYGANPFVAALLCMSLAVPALPESLDVSKPEDVGMSSERLQRAFGILQGWLNEGVVSAVASIVARRGRIAGDEAP